MMIKTIVAVVLLGTCFVSASDDEILNLNERQSKFCGAFQNGQVPRFIKNYMGDADTEMVFICRDGYPMYKATYTPPSAECTDKKGKSTVRDYPEETCNGKKSYPLPGRISLRMKSFSPSSSEHSDCINFRCEKGSTTPFASFKEECQDDKQQLCPKKKKGKKGQ